MSVETLKTIWPQQCANSIVLYSDDLTRDSVNMPIEMFLKEKSSTYIVELSTVFPKEFDVKSMIEKIKLNINMIFYESFKREHHKVTIVSSHQKEKFNFCRINVFMNIDSVSPKEIEHLQKVVDVSKKFKLINLKAIHTHSISLEDQPISSKNSNQEEFWKTISFDKRMLSDDNFLKFESPFKRFYGIESQIRLVLSPIQCAIDSAGKRMVHSVLFGPPACGKTSVLNKLEEIVGKHNVLKLDAPTTTKAGIEKLFLNNDIPPIVILEEAEKANEDWLRNWLSLLDERSEIRKVNHKETIVKDIDILFYCTVNDSDRFNDLLDGALASRCKNKIYFPRPDITTIEKILYRDIEENGGKKEWVPPALQLAKELNIDDPRIILSFLSGGDRLLTGSYQQDKKKCINTSLIV